ncbi:MAG: hypothetical protein JXM69_11000 [Anaerolineae bacterium]|nr:hypothetical protein [Anaerolineae bacterium]
MDYMALIKRAFQITIKYRALWIFGFFLALCSASGSGGGGSGGGGGTPPPTGEGGGNGFEGVELLFESLLTSTNIWLIIGGIVAAVLCLILILIVIGVIVRAVTRTSLIGMVDQIEETGDVTIKEGWRIGWSKRAWRIFLIGLIIGVPLAVIFITLLLVALSPLLLIFLENTALTVLGIVATIGLFLLWILAVIIVGIVVSPFQELAWRYTVIREMGAIESLKASYALIRQNLKEVAIVVLLLIGVGIGWAVVSIILSLIVVLLALVVGVIPGLLAYLVTQTWWMGVLVGGLLFMVMMILPLTFAQGLYLIFQSTLWTLSFREWTLTGRLSIESGLTGETTDESEANHPAETDTDQDS